MVLDVRGEKRYIYGMANKNIVLKKLYSNKSCLSDKSFFGRFQPAVWLMGASLFLAACGDSDSGTKSNDNGNATAPTENVYSSEDDLPACMDKYEGEIAIVKDGYVAYKCEDGRWIKKGVYFATKDGMKNCTEKREGEIAYTADNDETFVCKDGKWVKEDNEAIQDSDKSSSSASRQSNPESSSEKSAANSSSSSNAVSSSSWNHEVVTGSCSSSEEIASNSSSSSAQSSSSIASSSSAQKESSSSVSQSEVEGASSSAKSSSSSAPSSSSATSSSSSVAVATPCKTETEDNCEYDVLKDSRDGKEYKTVKIGDQWWMAENLNFEYKVKPAEGDSVSYGNYCNTDNCETYGRYYTWAAAMDSAGIYSDNGKNCGCNGPNCEPIYSVKGICPDGWHLPNTSEWEALFKTVGGQSTASKVLKSASGWNNTIYSSGNGTDAFGFSALSTGSRFPSGGFFNGGSNTDFWTSIVTNNGRANHVNLPSSENAIIRNGENDYAFSVRCVKD